MSPRSPTPLQIVAALIIIAVMAAILFPIFARHDKRNPHVFCPANLKQLGLGLAQYSQDNDEMMPNISNGTSASTWRTLVHPYVRSQGPYECPDRDPDDHDANPIGEDGFSQNYAANDTGDARGRPDQGNGAFAAPGSKPVSVTSVASPQNLIALTEVAYNPFPQFNIDDARSFSPASRKLWAGHQGRGNYLFFDGHVQALRPLDTDRESGGLIHDLWYRDSTRPLSANGRAVLQDAQRRFTP